VKILYDLPQGSPEWFSARCGRATASNFSAVMAKGQGKTRQNYLLRVAAETLTGKPMDTYSNGHMERGKEQESDARNEYERIRDVMVQEVGLILHDDILVAASPDFLLGEDGGGEIKSVIPTVQLETIRAGGYPSEHKAQIQGNLWTAERNWWDFISWSPDLPAPMNIYIHRVFRDEEYIANLEKETILFLSDVRAYIENVSELAEKASLWPLKRLKPLQMMNLPMNF